MECCGTEEGLAPRCRYGSAGPKPPRQSISNIFFPPVAQKMSASRRGGYGHVETRKEALSARALEIRNV